VQVMVGEGLESVKEGKGVTLDSFVGAARHWETHCPNSMGLPR
jgi:hypothetical protein